MIQELISIHNLSTTSVSISKQKIYVEEGQEPEPVGLPHWLAISNSEKGRKELREYLTDDSYYNAVITLWGNKPVIFENTEPSEI